MLFKMRGYFENEPELKADISAKVSGIMKNV
jgi:hypothetical protein